MSVETASTLPPPAKLKRPRQLSQAELDLHFPIDCAIDKVTHTVTVNPAWERVNIVRYRLPTSFGWSGSLRLHKNAVDAWNKFFLLVSGAKLQSRIVTIDGGYNPRLKRGANVPPTKAGLSRHARGLAVDFNAAYNLMGHPGAAKGAYGSLVDLFPLANEAQLVCGADWHGASIDPMHIELGTFNE